MTTPADTTRTENLKSEHKPTSQLTTQMPHVTTYKDPTGTGKVLQQQIICWMEQMVVACMCKQTNTHTHSHGGH